MATIDIDRDAAHDAAQRELNKPIYPRGSLIDQLLRWLDDLIFKIMQGGASVPGGWLTIGVLVLLLVAAVVVAIRVARRTMRTGRGQGGLFGSVEMSAEQHRSAAEQAAARGDWAVAIRHRLRAVARQLEESSVLSTVPGRTATELARDAGQAIPGLSGELRRAAVIFNDVTYGELPGTEPAYRLVADLDDQLRAHATAGQAGAEAMAAADGWAEVR